jgi:hypothetical protein
MLFKEIIAVYSENIAKPINIKHRVTECYNSCDTDFKVLDTQALVVGF